MQIEFPVCRFLNDCPKSKLVIVVDCASCHCKLVAINREDPVFVRRLDEFSKSTQQLVLEHQASQDVDSVSVVELVMLMEDDDGEGDDSAAAVRR